jgi:dolichyl-phosphate beta-glucosyltransferase
MTTLTIVVPCYNEERRLEPDLFLEYTAAHPDVRFLMVDDGSTDGTVRILERMVDGGNGAVDLLRLPENCGKAEAVRRGVLHAVKGAPGAFGYWDADLSTALEEIEAFRLILEAKPEMQVVMGSRVKLLGRKIERRAARHYAGRLFATFASLTLDLPVYDTQCGAKLFRNTRGTRFVFRQPFLSRWLFDVEILARLGLLGQRRAEYATQHCVFERPLPAWRDIAGSKIRFVDWVKAVWELVRIGWRYRLCSR